YSVVKTAPASAEASAVWRAWSLTAPIDVWPLWFVCVVSMQFDTSSETATVKNTGLQINASSCITPPPSVERVLMHCSRWVPSYPTACAELPTAGLEVPSD